MGNTNCVAGGDTPHRSDIVLCNQTDIDLYLDQRQSCNQDCNHRGFVVTNGKIVEGCEPPQILSANSIGRFSVSGREGSAVAPGGKVFYRNEHVNLDVCITWACSGWTHNLLSVSAPEQDHLSAVVAGQLRKKKDGGVFLFRNKPIPPWHEVLSVVSNPSSMELTIKPKALLDDVKGLFNQMKDVKII